MMSDDLAPLWNVYLQCCPLTNCAYRHFVSSEAHILEDVNKCVQALQEKDPENVDRAAGQIRGRTARLEDVVTAEMENYQQGPYTDNVMRAVLVMRNESKRFCNNMVLSTWPDFVSDLMQPYTNKQHHMIVLLNSFYMNENINHAMYFVSSTADTLIAWYK